MTAAVGAIEERGGAWLRLVLDHPKGNLLSLEMVRALALSIDRANVSGRKWLTIEGAGGDFSFGAKIQEHVPGPMERVLIETHAVFRRLLALPVATAALVEGRCLGGGFELALTCDVIIAAEDASLGLPEVRIGAFPPAGSALLPVRVGASRAAAAVIGGVARSAAVWHQAGLIEMMAAKGSTAAAAGEWFDTHLAPHSAVALAAAAQASRYVVRAAVEPAMAAAERLYLERVLSTHDAAEGVRAFVEKRAPEWKDR
jgi:cyclohexa-1,5-dienecarbonyl-CoA hydratase